MKQSWSHKLFFRINAQVGRRRWLDNLMWISAHWLIYILAILALTWGEIILDPEFFKLYIKFLLTALVFAIFTNWLFGLLWPHPRPIVEFFHTKQLFQPYKTWKAFPSDHATISFAVVFVTSLVGAPGWFVTVLFVLALQVSVARVYAGVHYPRDIIGGFLVALLYSSLAFWLVTNVTQPLYIFLNNIL